MPQPKNRGQLLYAQFALGKRPSHPDVKAIRVAGEPIKRNTVFRYFQSFKDSIGPVESNKLFPPEEAPTMVKKQVAKAVEGSVAEEKTSSVVEDSEAEEKPTEKPEGAVEKTGKDVLAPPKIKETAAAQALRKAQGKEVSALHTTKSIGEAAWIRVIPREFTISATIFWSAMEATINYWGWPADISPEDWLDKYLRITMEQRDVNLGPSRVPRPGADDGNGEHEATEQEIDWTQEYQSYDRIDLEAPALAASATQE